MPLEKGLRLTIQSPSAQNAYVQPAPLNGQRLVSRFFSGRRDELIFTMGAQLAQK